MELLYNFPDILKPYFEYIPEDELRNIITVALEHAVLSRAAAHLDEVAPSNPQEELLQRIEEMFKNVQVAAAAVPVQQPKPIIKPKPAPPPPPPMDESGEEISAVDAFLLDVMK